jgi:hypothetical protein
VARAGDTLGSLPERHVGEMERSRLSEMDGFPPGPGEGDQGRETLGQVSS